MSPFPTTNWTLIIAADSRDSTAAREALAELCDTYWRPLYVYARGAGYGVPDAQDIVQGFLVKTFTNALVRPVGRTTMPIETRQKAVTLRRQRCV